MFTKPAIGARVGYAAGLDGHLETGTVRKHSDDETLVFVQFDGDLRSKAVYITDIEPLIETDGRNIVEFDEKGVWHHSPSGKTCDPPGEVTWTTGGGTAYPEVHIKFHGKRLTPKVIQDLIDLYDIVYTMEPRNTIILD